MGFHLWVWQKMVQARSILGDIAENFARDIFSMNLQLTAWMNKASLKRNLIYNLYGSFLDGFKLLSLSFC